MKRLLTNRTIGITELREPAKVLEQAKGRAVAVLKNNECVAYFVPAEAVDEITSRHASRAEVVVALEETKKADAPVLEYLKDK